VSKLKHKEMKLSKVHQELLDSFGGYDVREDEKTLYHIMFIDILPTGGRTEDRAIFQKYFPKEWVVMKRAIEKLGIKITGHNEYAILHDPTLAEPKADVKPKPRTRASQKK